MSLKVVELQEKSKLYTLDESVESNIDKTIPIKSPINPPSPTKFTRFQSLKNKIYNVSSAFRQKLGQLFESNSDNENEVESPEEISPGKYPNDNENQENEENENNEENQENQENDDNPDNEENQEKEEKDEKEEEDDGNLYTDESGKVYWVDSKGNVYLCSENNGEYNLEEYLGVCNPAEIENKSQSTTVEELNFQVEEGFESKKSQRIHRLRDKGDCINNEEKTLNFFEVYKENNKKTSFFSFFGKKQKKFLFMEEGILYFLRLDGKNSNNFIITSVQSLSRLFKVYLEKKDNNKLTLAFFNENFDYQKPPISKHIWCDKKNELLISLKNELHLRGKPMKVEIY